jgi:hypothetical protein
MTPTPPTDPAAAGWSADTDDPAVEPTGAPTAPDTPATPVEPETPNAEAQRLRSARRAVEAERDAVLARLTKLQTREAVRLASADLAKGEDLFEIGKTDLASLLTEDGGVNEDAVRSAVNELLDGRPGLRKPAGFPDLGQGRRRQTAAPKTTWADWLQAKPGA